MIYADEVHRDREESYYRIMLYYEPKLWLSMTVTHELTDEFNIFDILNQNIAYEIRLHRALEEYLFCPFHYLGITDLDINREMFDDNSESYSIKHGTCPIFVTYEKKEDIANSTKYEDQFINNQIFSWKTRSKVTINSTESKELINYRENNLKIYLFIKKSDGEGSDFYYMGKVIPIEWNETVIENDHGTLLPIMNFKLQLENSVRNDIYEYFTK